MEGNSKFFNGTEELDYEIGDFWKWYASNLLHGPLRGALAEYIVAKALGIECDERNIFAPADLCYDGHQLEVKSTAYLQQKQDLHLTKRLSFDIGEHRHNGETKRHSDFYIFCLYHCKDLQNHNVMQMKDWTFYILPTPQINEELGTKRSLSFRALDALRPAIATYDTLKGTLDELCKK